MVVLLEEFPCSYIIYVTESRRNPDVYLIYLHVYWFTKVFLTYKPVHKGSTTNILVYLHIYMFICSLTNIHVYYLLTHIHVYLLTNTYTCLFAH